MSYIDKQYRYDLGINNLTYLGFFKTLTHLDHVDPNLTHIAAAAHFLSFWRQKHHEMQNNILHRKVADTFEEQVRLANKTFFKVQGGLKLTYLNFEGKKFTLLKKITLNFLKPSF